MAKETLYLYIWRKIGPKCVRFGRLVRIRQEDLLDWAKSGSRHPSVRYDAKKPAKDEAK